MSFPQFNTANGTRFIYQDYDYTPLASDPNPFAGRPFADWQPIPTDSNNILDYISLHRCRRTRQDEKRPYIVTRSPHAPPLDSQLVIRFQGVVKSVDFSILGSWDKTTQRSSCARATRSISIGADVDRPHLWTHTIKAYNNIREAIRHHLFQTGEFSRQLSLGDIPERVDSVLKFEQRVFETGGEIRYAPDYLGVNGKLDEIASRWHLTEQVPTLRTLDAGPATTPMNPGLIQENDFVDVAAIVNITINPPRRFYLSLEVLRVVQLRPAPTAQTAEEDSEDDIGTGPIIDYVLPTPNLDRRAFNLASQRTTPICPCKSPAPKVFSLTAI